MPNGQESGPLKSMVCLTHSCFMHDAQITDIALLRFISISLEGGVGRDAQPRKQDVGHFESAIRVPRMNFQATAGVVVFEATICKQSTKVRQAEDISCAGGRKKRHDQVAFH
jgi:hypothetical protein